MPYLVLVVADEEAQNLSVPPEDEASEVAKIFGTLKVYGPMRDFDGRVEWQGALCPQAQP